MEPERFIEAYQDALGTHKWSNVERLIAKDASVTFSDGTVHLGKEKVQKAFQRNFDIIKSETYTIDKVKWLKKENDYAVYIFEFNWSGKINGQLVSGNGNGTSVLIKEDKKWKLLAEHLGKK